ncbi:hypothetical protein ACOSQ4_000259 [Xanthoceras sorbifolium]
MVAVKLSFPFLFSLPPLPSPFSLSKLTAVAMVMGSSGVNSSHISITRCRSIQISIKDGINVMGDSNESLGAWKPVRSTSHGENPFKYPLLNGD